MNEVKWASGQWHVHEGKVDEFIERWTGWIAWTSENIPGFRSARLLRAEGDPLRFVSISDWDDDASLKAWKASPGFREKIESVKELCDDFLGGDYDTAAVVPGARAPRLEVLPATRNTTRKERTMTVHYQHEGIAEFPTTTDTIFQYMSHGGHPHAAFKSHRLVDLTGNVVTIAAEVYNPDGSTFETTIEHRLDPPRGVETRMIGGAFDGARFTHRYTPENGQTRVDLAGEFPAMPGMSEADELAMIDGFFTMVFGEDTETLRTWTP